MFTIGEGRHPFKAENYNQLERIVCKGKYQFKEIKDKNFQRFLSSILRIIPCKRPRAQELLCHDFLDE